MTDKSLADRMSMLVLPLGIAMGAMLTGELAVNVFKRVTRGKKI